MGHGFERTGRTVHLLRDPPSKHGPAHVLPGATSLSG